MSNLTRRDPLDDFFRGFLVRPVEYGGGNSEAPQMRVDVKEVDDNYQVHAELPGIKKEDIHVHIDGPVVSISAERKQSKEVKEGERVLRGVSVILCSRRFDVSCPAAAGQETSSHRAIAGMKRSV